MKKKLINLIAEYNRKEDALKGLIKNVPKKYWTDEDSKLARTLRMQMYKLLSDIHKESEK